ncbi:DUF397 domain-containing protein [Actinokineospora xionganensis]|uniref:DUF397 domain-containing protein n=1 Tax=Actinokineospora xionganensis TaxID=2684470 RepID=A0ABR7L260_9PSEU|nr:DUF397 domain-containing protein [Actinokineospora xionganensis]MBC6446769.1 DUF397 domain-containing protein [Actinokineospora xionganensis]
MPVWRKSGFSTGNGGDGDCVEVALSSVARVRDSKNATGPQLSFPAARWRSFTQAASSSDNASRRNSPA